MNRRQALGALTLGAGALALGAGAVGRATAPQTPPAICDQPKSTIGAPIKLTPPKILINVKGRVAKRKLRAFVQEVNASLGQGATLKIV